MLILPGKSASWGAEPGFLDDFNRANELLTASAKWTKYGSSSAFVEPEIVSNEVFVDGNTAGYKIGTYLYEETLTDDQFAEIQVNTAPSGGCNLGVCVRHQRAGAAVGNYYEAVFDPAGTVIVRRSTNGSYTTIGSASLTWTAGVKVRIEASGTTIRVLTDSGSGFVERASGTDATYSTGDPGIVIFNNTVGTATGDNFRCGDLA